MRYVALHKLFIMAFVDVLKETTLLCYILLNYNQESNIRIPLEANGQ